MTDDSTYQTRAERVAKIALWLGSPIDVIALVMDRTGVSRRTAYRWASMAQRSEPDQANVAAHLWLTAVRIEQAKEDEMARWMLNQRPRDSGGAKAREMESRRLSKDQLIAAAAEMGLAVYAPAPWDRGEPWRRKRKRKIANGK